MTENGQKIKLLRLYELLRRETDEDHPIFRMDLCQRLNDMGISSNVRTLSRDIKEKKQNKRRAFRMGKYVTKKKEMNFKNVDSLQPVVNVVNEAAAALNDKTRTIKESAIPEVLAGALGAGIGGIASFAALYGLGVVGLSAAGITSGLAAAGAIVGGGMVAGVFVLAAPVAILAAGGVGLAVNLKNKQLKQEKERLYQEVLRKHEAIINARKDEAEATQKRLDYLQSLNILLTQAIKDLQHDLGLNAT